MTEVHGTYSETKYMYSVYLNSLPQLMMINRYVLGCLKSFYKSISELYWDYFSECINTNIS